MALYLPEGIEDRFPRAGVLATEIADVGNNARHEGVTVRRRILRLRRSTAFSNPETESPRDALMWFAQTLVRVGFRCLHAAHHAAGRAAGFDHPGVLELGGIRDQLGSLIVTEDALAGKPASIPMPWEPYVAEASHDA